VSMLTSFLVTPINPRPPVKEKEVLPVMLEQMVIDHVGSREPGPHSCGKAEVLSDGRLLVTLVNIEAGRAAEGLMRVDALDAVHWQGTVRLRVQE
jgi:hypothetical protein